ncbi:hypothetical protein N7448_003099 [Penicillium atrosanguineum]|nr:hypothetical protein N7448_003099 [Penicillium atrosanguineum]
MPESSFDPQLCAKLHNRILEHAWVGAGRDLASLPSTSWWEESSPITFDLASRLSPKLILFLRLARSVIWRPNDADFHFFYYLRGLASKKDLLRFYMLESRGDRYVWLYPGSTVSSDDEAGILFDQKTDLAAFFPDWECVTFAEEKFPWKPLQHILTAYLEMIDERKVTTYTDKDSVLFKHSEPCFPWQMHQYTQCDIEKATTAFTRLINAIEYRIPSDRPTHTPLSSNWVTELPYSNSVLDECFVPRDSFVRSFLSALPARNINFRHIAPGIRIQSPSEFISQPFADRRDNFRRLSKNDQNPHSIPVLLFRGEGLNISPWIRPWFPDEKALDIPVGLYSESVCNYWAVDFGNGSRLLLPFDLGAKGARAGGSAELYQFFNFSGFQPMDSTGVQIHKVFLNWASRVETGDWEVNEDGVAGGIEKFKEADTSGHWTKYQIPLSW